MLRHVAQPATVTVEDSQILPVPTDGHTLVDTVCGPRDDIVEFVRHASRTRDIGHTAWAVEFGSQDVVQHPTSISNLKASRLDAPNLQRQKQQLRTQGAGRTTKPHLTCPVPLTWVQSGLKNHTHPRRTSPLSEKILQGLRVKCGSRVLDSCT